jgi:hypothetical protein
MLNLVGIYDRMNARGFLHQNHANTQKQTRIIAEFRTSPTLHVGFRKLEWFQVLIGRWAK